MSWVSVGVAGVGFVSSLFGSSQKRKAAKEAKQLGIANAANIKMESEEEARRLRLAQEQTTGKAKLGIAASGFRSGKKSMGGSHKAYLANLKSVQQSELDWIAKSSRSRQDIARRGGNVAASQLTAGSYDSLASAAGFGIQGYGALKSAGKI